MPNFMAMGRDISARMKVDLIAAVAADPETTQIQAQGIEFGR